ncbi:hypothetical protein [Phytohabitans aurantiacus]|uniref:Uncharacterized protein n=1 Tax=Phytohabitans aurantiacus TaxID=3016789 RepID=A0ABQ5RAG1_9ACTN|nr:hypothetical protein [Phytohabitans aurantiacus]GLI03385.1 hypothetical protein Pa4123_86630 [Phytohabitans aurantiacus]
MYRAFDDGIEIVAEGGQGRVRLLAPQRPFADEFLDFRVELQDLGLNAATGVRTIGGDGIAAWAKMLADSYAGWDDEPGSIRPGSLTKIEKVTQRKTHPVAHHLIHGSILWRWQHA